jgi:hypothetical protein
VSSSIRAGPSDNSCRIEAAGRAGAASAKRRTDGRMSAMCPPLDHMPAIQQDPPSHEITGRRRRAEQKAPDLAGLLAGQRRPLIDHPPNVFGHPLCLRLPPLVSRRQDVFSKRVTAMLVVRQVLGHWDTVATIATHRSGEPARRMSGPAVTPRQTAVVRHRNRAKATSRQLPAMGEIHKAWAASGRDPANLWALAVGETRTLPMRGGR